MQRNHQIRSKPTLITAGLNLRPVIVVSNLRDSCMKTDSRGLLGRAQPLFEMTLPFAGLSGFRLSSAGDQLFAWTNSDGVVWDLNSTPPREPRFRLTGQYTKAAFFTPDGQHLATANGLHPAFAKVGRTLTTYQP